MKVNLLQRGSLGLLILAIFLRLLVSALLFHPDIKTIAFQTSFLKKGVVDIYPYLLNNRTMLPLKEEFVYFPLTYFTVGSYQLLISSILGSQFDDWINDAGTSSVVNNPNIFMYLVLLKLPLLFMDISVAYLLLNYFHDKKKGKQAFNLWLFNPFTIVLIYAFSNIDIYAVLLTVIAFLYIKKEQLIKAGIFIGLAASFKLYPLLFVPFLFLKAKTTNEKLLTILVPVGILLAIVIPFLSPAFIQSALVSGLSTRIFSPGITIGFGESIIIGIFLLSALFFYGLLFDKKVKLFNYFAILLFIIFSFSHFHISWLLWIAPFLVIISVKKSSLSWPILFWIIFAISIPLFYADRAMTLSLYRIYSNWFDLLPTPFTVLLKFYDPYNFQGIIHSALAGLSGVLTFKLLKEENDDVNT